VERRRLIAESTAEVTAIRHRLETLSQELEGTRHLYESTHSVSKEELQETELEYKLVQTELERLLTAERREEIEYRIAQAQLEEYLVRAPFDGVVIKRYIEVGENCSPQQPLIRVADVSKCRLIVLVDPVVSTALAPNQAVRLRIDGLRSPNVLGGSVEYLSPVVDPSSGLREVKVLFDNPDGRVYPGMTGTLLLR
jgi:multidrug efflux pump subunit AcrA (membrane-fusion protein)